MLLEIAIGDAYGAGFEFVPEMSKYNDLSRYVQNPKLETIKPGQYTDDTQMSIAIAELILSGDEWTPINIANRFVDCFKRDWRNGYARGFQKFLESVNSGQEFLDNIRPFSEKSGAAMRACPIGLYPDVREVLEKAEIQAKLTHDTKIGIDSAKVAALMTHLCFYDKRVYSYLCFMHSAIDHHIPGYEWGKYRDGPTGQKGHTIVHSALTEVRRNVRLSKLLRSCVDLTGDTDTVAAIALGAASCSSEYTKDLPDALANGLEDGKFGKRYLVDLDTQLMGKF